jgi:hypothetical protein
VARAEQREVIVAFVILRARQRERHDDDQRIVQELALLRSMRELGRPRRVLRE